MPEPRQTRRLAAIMVADLVGYSRLMGADEAGTLGQLRSVQSAVIQPALSAHRGRMVKEMGDGILVEFASVVDAVQCAVAIQEAVAAQNAKQPENGKMQFRIGINLGDIIVDGDDVFGDGVNIAARLEGQAEPGGVVVSVDAYRQIRSKLPLAFEDLGERKLKNIAEPVRVYRYKSPGSSCATQFRDPSARPSLAVIPHSNIGIGRGTSGTSRVNWGYSLSPRAASGAPASASASQPSSSMRSREISFGRNGTTAI